jgi:hypothetical protein
MASALLTAPSVDKISKAHLNIFVLVRAISYATFLVVFAVAGAYAVEVLNSDFENLKSRLVGPPSHFKKELETIDMRFPSPWSLTLATLPSMSLIPSAPFTDFHR